MRKWPKSKNLINAKSCYMQKKINERFNICTAGRETYEDMIGSLRRALHRPVSQRSWVRIPFRPELFQALISQLLKLCEFLR